MSQSFFKIIVDNHYQLITKNYVYLKIHKKNL